MAFSTRLSVRIIIFSDSNGKILCTDLLHDDGRFLVTRILVTRILVTRFLVTQRGERLLRDYKSDDQRDSGEQTQSNENTSSTINGFVAIVHEITEAPASKRPWQPI
jgi:hypothetical protein